MLCHNVTGILVVHYQLSSISCMLIGVYPISNLKSDTLMPEVLCGHGSVEIL